MRKLVSLFVFLFLCTPTFALTWDEVRGLAEQKNHELISAQKDVESSELTYKKAFATFFPQISASGGFSESRSSTTGAVSQSYSYGLSVSQSLFEGMDNIYGVQSAYAALEYQKASFQNTAAAVYYNLRSAFLDLLTAQEQAVLLGKILNQRKENTRLITLRYESGKEDKGNLLSTRADLVSAQYDLASAQRDLKLAKLKLSQLLAQDVDIVEEEIKQNAPEVLDFDQIIKSSPSYTMTERSLEEAELAQKSTISGFLPSVSLSGSLGKRGSTWPPAGDSNSWSLNLSYSFFPGGSNFAQRAIYNAKLDKAKEDYKQSLLDLRYSLEDAYASFKDTLEALDVARISLEAAKERAKIIRAKYLNGLTTYDEWTRLENTYISSEKSLLNSKKSALLAEAAWYKSYGGYKK